MNDETRLPTVLGQIAHPAVRRLPALIEAAGRVAAYAYDEFLEGELSNDNTRKAYRHAIDRFLAWSRNAGLRLDGIMPAHLAGYIRALRSDAGHPASKPTQKLHLAAIRHMFDRLVVRHVVPINPAASVRGPRYQVTEGLTPALSVAQARHVLASISTHSTAGTRDRAIIAILIYTAARAGAIARLRRSDFYTDGRQWLFRFDEKGGRVRQIPARHDVESFVSEYLQLVNTTDDGASLFRSLDGRSGRLTLRGLTGNDILRIVKRRLAAAGLPAEQFSCHSFRATTATDLLTQGVPIEDVQFLLGHADPRTTQIYDRRKRQVTRNIVERISV